MADPTGKKLGGNVVAIGVVSFFTDVSSEMIYPLLPVFLSSVLGANASFIGSIEGAAESTSALLKLASGWWSDRVTRRKPLVVFGYGISSLVRPLIALMQSAGQVLAIRVVDRVGKGIRTTPRDALLAESVAPEIRGRAFGFHRAMDNAGAVIGPLIAFALLTWWGTSIRTVFWLSAVPALIAFLVLLAFVKDVPRDASRAGARESGMRGGSAGGSEGLEPQRALGRRFWAYLVVVLTFTLGNSTDAFLLLRANQLGVPVALAPVLWALLSLVKASTATHGGGLSDRLGRKPLIVAGWLLYAAVYFAFARASAAWQAWVLFAVYGVFYGLTEGAERALVVDIVPANRKGTALGWYNLAVGLGALPASLLFGAIWDRVSPAAAFTFGAALALLAAVGLMAVVPPARRVVTVS